MPARVLESAGILCRVEIRVDELDQAVQVLCRHGVVLLVEVVDVAIQNLDEEFNGDGGVHAGVCDAQGTLETFEDALAVTVGLDSIDVSVCAQAWKRFW